MGPKVFVIPLNLTAISWFKTVYLEWKNNAEQQLNLSRGNRKNCGFPLLDVREFM